MEKLKNMFLSPSAEFRTAPLWVWNSHMEDAEIEKTLVELKNHGFGGAFVHPRPGMKLSYLDDAYFSRWKKALEVAKGLGLFLNIYDENSYPSGFGGGHVSAELPDCLSESMRYQVIEEKDMNFTKEEADWLGSSELIGAYACDKKNGKMVMLKELTQSPQSDWKGQGKYYVIITHLVSQTAGWLAGFADIDRLRPEVTAMFLEKVYDKYAEHFQQEFGEGIKAIFTDEPSLPGSTVYGKGGQDSLPINHWFAYEFSKRKHYDILKCIPSLFDDWEGVENEKIRHDYYQVTYELWKENFLEPIRDWCTKHHIKFTGHFMEDGWPKPYYCVVSPGVMSYYEYQDWPGVDLLLTGRLKDGPAEVQEISLLEVMSASHQLGKERVFCEAFGAGGYDSQLTDYKRIGDYLFANGVNYINEHLSYTSYVGARKRDHPQSFDWRQSWWEEYTYLNDYFARLSVILSSGETKSRFLVLNPTLTGYLYPKKEDESQLINNILAKEPNMQPFLQLLDKLRQKQWDYHLGDEYLLQRHGKVQGNRLEVVKQSYQAIILHESIQNVLPSTLILLEDFLKQGGSVLSVGKMGDFVEGCHTPEAYEAIFASINYRQFASEEELLLHLTQTYMPYFSTNQLLPMGVRSLRRVEENGQEIYFIANQSKKSVEDCAAFIGTYMEEWDPWLGTVKVVGKADSNGVIQLPLSMKDGESKVFCVYHNEKEVKISEPILMGEKEEEILKSKNIIPLDYNTWPLEYCDLRIDGEEYCDRLTIAAGIQIFQKRGFHANPWDNEVQYKTRTYDRNVFYDENSGFSAIYHFTVEEEFVPETLLLCVEYGERYHISINGKALLHEENETFIDMHIKQYNVKDFVISGENQIMLTADRFDVELELEAVILRGDFGVYQKNEKWIMGKKPKLKEGGWIAQGYPFYSGAVCYESQVKYDGTESIGLFVDNVEATGVSLSVNGETIGLIHCNGIKEMDLTQYLKVGDNTVVLKVCGSMKNLLGPHFDPSNPRRTAWPDMWKNAPAYGLPKVAEYDLIEYGLFGATLLHRSALTTF